MYIIYMMGAVLFGRGAVAPVTATSLHKCSRHTSATFVYVSGFVPLKCLLTRAAVSRYMCYDPRYISYDPRYMCYDPRYMCYDPRYMCYLPGSYSSHEDTKSRFLSCSHALMLSCYVVYLARIDLRGSCSREGGKKLSQSEI